MSLSGSIYNALGTLVSAAQGIHLPWSAQGEKDDFVERLARAKSEKV